jgi:hypothetical protein
MGYFRGFIHGTVVGTAAGLCLAPREGAATRAQLRAAAATFRGGLARAQDTATRVAPVVESTRQRAIVVIGRARRARQRTGPAPYEAGAGAYEQAPASSEWATGSPPSPDA